MEISRTATTQAAAPLASMRALLAELAIDAGAIARGMEVADVVAAHSNDPDLIVAALLASVARDQLGANRTPGLDLQSPALVKRAPAASLELAGTAAALGDLHLGTDFRSEQGLHTQQAETLRKMLLAVASDPRLVLVRLAQQLVHMHHARREARAEQHRLAVETQQVFAPLANRLGVWNLKWELEDLAFRILEPQAYQTIAAALAERRIDREQYIAALCAELQAALAHAGVDAQVHGRPKHIFSIWRKMQRKHLDFARIYDVRALRIVVDTVADCYAALGLVHGRWPFIASEFDDYIATPKDNLYRSIHTAVTGPGGKAVEIQIRTREMHEQSELGVAAHWRYKEGGGRDARYEQKIEWARRLLDPAAPGAEDSEFLDSVRRGLFADRIYVLTPQGDVIDLPRGATPLDFAYHVHTGLGHRVRGAKANGRIITLNTPLTNGMVVEIIAGRTGGPSRDWLNPEAGFLASPRSRAKVRAWFHQQAAAETAKSAATRSEPATAPPAAAERDAPRPAPKRAPRRKRGVSLVDIEGVGDLPTTMARCCAPMPPAPIAGYVTLGRGVTIHRAECPSLARMSRLHPQRVLQVQWNLAADDQLPIRLQVEAYDRRGLLRDVTDLLAQAHLSIEGVNSDTDPRDRIATIVLRTAVRDTAQLRELLQKLSRLPNVLRAQRLD